MNFSKLHPYLIAYRKWFAAFLISMTFIYLVQAGNSAEELQIVTATHDLPAGTKLKPEDMRISSTSFSWAGTYTNAGLLAGKHLKINIVRNQPITESEVSVKQIFDPSNPGAVAISLPNNSSSAALQTGARVDVFATTNNGRAKRVVSNALVLNQDGAKNELNSVSTVLLAINPDQVSEIASVNETTSFTFVTLAQK